MPSRDVASLVITYSPPWTMPAGSYLPPLPVYPPVAQPLTKPPFQCCRSGSLKICIVLPQKPLPNASVMPSRLICWACWEIWLPLSMAFPIPSTLGILSTIHLMLSITHCNGFVTKSIPAASHSPNFLPALAAASKSFWVVCTGESKSVNHFTAFSIHPTTTLNAVPSGWNFSRTGARPDFKPSQKPPKNARTFSQWR